VVCKTYCSYELQTPNLSDSNILSNTHNALWYYWCSITFFSFPSFPEFHIVVTLLQVLHLSLFMIMLVFVYMLSFLMYLPCIREKKHSLSFWAWLLHLAWWPPLTSIYLQTMCHRRELVAQACNPSYSGGTDQEDQRSKIVRKNNAWNLILKNPSQKNRAGRVP
jgi:hypothetical protein